MAVTRIKGFYRPSNAPVEDLLENLESIPRAGRSIPRRGWCKDYEVMSGGILRERKEYRCIRQSYVEIAIV